MVLLDGCYGSMGLYMFVLLLLMITIVIVSATCCCTGRKTVTVEDLLQPDAPFVRREVKVSNQYNSCNYGNNKSITILIG